MDEHDRDREHAILAAANYWRVLLERNKAPSLVGDAQWQKDDPQAHFGEALIAIARGQHPDPTREQIDLFERLLIANIRADWRHAIDGTQVSIDYHPCRLLGDALYAAGIGGGDLQLPYKTVTQLVSYEVQAKNGYAGWFGVIWQTKRGALIERVRAAEGFEYAVKRRAQNFVERCAELPVDKDLDGAAFVVLTMARAQEHFEANEKRHA